MNQIWIQCIGRGWDMEAIEIFYSKEVGQVDLCVYFCTCTLTSWRSEE